MVDKIINCRKIVEGKAEGIAIISKNPINFLAMIDLTTGKIKDKDHDLYGTSIKDRILVFPHSIGSSVGAYSIYALKKNNSSPKGIICTAKTDTITASGCAIANIPVVDTNDIDFQNNINNNSHIILDATNQKIILKNFSK